MKQKINKSIKIILCILIGFIISISTIGTYAATLVAASNVSYTENSQTNVSGALDALYTRSKNLKHVIEVEGNLDYTWDGAGSCGAFKADGSSYVGVVSKKGDAYCLMRYDLGKSIGYERIFVEFITSGNETSYHNIHHTGGDSATYYKYRLVMIDEDYEEDYSSDGSSFCRISYEAYISGQYLYVKFHRYGDGGSNATSCSRNIQLRGLPYFTAEIIQSN